MKILFYDTFDYDKSSFENALKDYPDITIDFLEADLNPMTATLANGYDAVCGFVNSDIKAMTLEILAGFGIKLVLMRCAGFDAVNLDVARDLGMSVLRVPGYSPEAIAEFALGLAATSCAATTASARTTTPSPASSAPPSTARPRASWAPARSALPCARSSPASA